MIIVDDAAGRSSTGHRGQNGTIGPVRGDVWSFNGESPLPILTAATAVRSLRLDSRGDADRRRLHVPGDGLPVRRLHRQRGPSRGGSPSSPTSKPVVVKHPTKAEFAGRVPPLQARRAARASLGGAVGTKGLEHRVGDLEKADVTGNVEYSPTNHQHMTDIRFLKIAGIADYIPEQTVEGPESGRPRGRELGRNTAACGTAVRQAQSEGKSVAPATCATSIRSRETSGTF